MNIDPKSIYDNFVKDQLTCDFRDSITVRAAVPIYQLDGSIGLWRIPLDVGGRVVGMIDVSTSGAVERYGLQVTKRSEIAGKQEDTLELTAAKIESLAVAVVDPQAVAVSQPRLVSLGAPTKVAWEVVMKAPKEAQRVTVSVTPGFAWIAADKAHSSE